MPAPRNSREYITYKQIQKRAKSQPNDPTDAIIAVIGFFFCLAFAIMSLFA